MILLFFIPPGMKEPLLGGANVTKELLLLPKSKFSGSDEFKVTLPNPIRVNPSAGAGEGSMELIPSGNLTCGYGKICKTTWGFFMGFFGTNFPKKICLNIPLDSALQQWEAIPNFPASHWVQSHKSPFFPIKLHLNPDTKILSHLWIKSHLPKNLLFWGVPFPVFIPRELPGIPGDLHRQISDVVKPIPSRIFLPELHQQILQCHFSMEKKSWISSHSQNSTSL